MKHHIHLRAAGIGALLLSGFVSFGQIAKTKITKPETTINVASSISKAATDVAVMEGLKTSHEKIYRRFARDFASASDLKVYPFKHTTALSCKVDGVQNNILYSNNGRWLHTVRYYGIELLPRDVRSIVAEAFPHYSLLRVAEISTPSGTAYLVDIESKNLYKTIRVVNYEWDVYQEFLKE